MWQGTLGRPKARVGERGGGVGVGSGSSASLRPPGQSKYKRSIFRKIHRLHKSCTCTVVNMALMRGLQFSGFRFFGLLWITGMSGLAARKIVTVWCTTIP